MRIPPGAFSAFAAALGIRIGKLGVWAGNSAWTATAPFRSKGGPANATIAPLGLSRHRGKSERIGRITCGAVSARGLGLLDSVDQWCSAWPEGSGVDAGSSAAAGSAVSAGPTTRALNR